MKKKGSNIIPFPKKMTDKFTKESYDLDTVHHVVNVVLDELEDLGYDIDDDQFKRDISVMANMMYASFARDHDYNKHVFHFIMDECHNMIVAAKVFADAHKDKMPIEPVVDDDVEIEYDEDPSNDNNRL